MEPSSSVQLSQRPRVDDTPASMLSTSSMSFDNQLLKQEANMLELQRQQQEHQFRSQQMSQHLGTNLPVSQQQQRLLGALNLPNPEQWHQYQQQHQPLPHHHHRQQPPPQLQQLRQQLLQQQRVQEADLRDLGSSTVKQESHHQSDHDRYGRIFGGGDTYSSAKGSALDMDMV